MTKPELDILESIASAHLSDPTSKELRGIVIYDGVCGMGKTHDIIEQINKLITNTPDARVIYVSPFLDELTRVGKELQATINGAKFFRPENRGKGKLHGLKGLLKLNYNILTTHKLFNGLDAEAIKLIQENNYHLIMDEEPPVMTLAEKKYKPNLSGNEVATFIENGTLIIDPNTDLVSWNTEGLREYTRYRDVKNDCDRGNIIKYPDNGKPILLWRQNPASFKCFKTIHVLTYLFKGSILQAYLDFYNIPYLIRDKTMEEFFSNNKIHPYHKLINFHQTKGDWMKIDKYTFSVSWYEGASRDDLDVLKKKTMSFFKTQSPFQKINTKSNQKLWTTFKDYRTKIMGAGFTKNFIPFNKRSTNDYIEANKMAYLVNLYLPPPITNYFKSKGIVVDSDNYSLSQMIQWLFRGAIRAGNPIHLFISSTRMRKLLDAWIKHTGETYDFSWLIFKEYGNKSIDKYLIEKHEQVKIEDYIKNNQPGLISFFPKAIKIQ